MTEQLPSKELFLDLDGTPLDDVSCEQCADVRLVIVRAEVRSDE